MRQLPLPSTRTRCRKHGDKQFVMGVSLNTPPCCNGDVTTLEFSSAFSDHDLDSNMSCCCCFHESNKNVHICQSPVYIVTCRMVYNQNVFVFFFVFFVFVFWGVGGCNLFLTPFRDYPNAARKFNNFSATKWHSFSLPHV